MSKKQYNVTTLARAAMPRSERLKRLGVTSSTIINSSSQGDGVPSDVNSHTHANKALLDSLASDADDYLYINNQVDGEAEATARKAKAGKADDATQWEQHNFDDYINQPVRTSDDVAFDSVATSKVVVTERVGTPGYMPGVAGSGFDLSVDEQGATHLEVDTLSVRQSLHAVETLIDKIRADNGSLVVSPASGKLAAVVQSGEQYKLYLEDDNNFVAGDLLRCQVFTGSAIKAYWVAVSSAVDDYVTVATSEFTQGNTPEVGDEVVLMGNTTDVTRQSAIYITSSDTGAPQIVVLDGIKSKSLSGCQKVVLGKLDDIVDTKLNPSGYGLYATNCFLKGQLALSGGSTVEDAIKDALSYTINIYTSSGNSFINGVDTTLVAQVMCGKDDVTSTLAAGYFSWRRVSRNTDGDAVWNQLHEGVGSSIHIGDDDVVRSAMFECVVTIDNTTYSSSNNN